MTFYDFFRIATILPYVGMVAAFITATYISLPYWSLNFIGRLSHDNAF